MTNQFDEKEKIRLNVHASNSFIKQRDPYALDS